MNQNERYFRGISSAIGFALLIFLALFNLMGFLIVPLSMILDLISPSDVFFNVVYEVVYGGMYLAIFMIPVAFLRLFIRKGGYDVQPMKWELRLSKKLPLILCAGIAVIYAGAYINSTLVSFAYWLAPKTTGIAGGAASNAPKEIYEIVLDFLVICLVPGFCEEFLFRGAILSNLLPFGRTRAILISALLFALMHQNVEQVFYAFVAGIFLGLVYERTGSIWNCTILHMMNNFYSVLQEDLFLGERDAVRSFGEMMFMEIVIFLLGAVCLYFLIRGESDRQVDLHGGIFEKDLPASDGYAQSPVASNRFLKCFLSPSMIAYLICCFGMVAFTFIAIAAGINVYG